MPVISLTDVSDAESQALSACDICIIGSGPAGSTLARELSGTSLRVTVLESGGFERDPTIDVLNDIESVGRRRVMDQWLVRNRVVGGSSHTWTGRCAAFDRIDFETRPWVPDSGWPIGLDDLAPYLGRSAEHLGLSVGADFSDDRFWSLAGRPVPAAAPDPERLLSFFWQFSRDRENSYEYMRFGRHIAGRIGPNVTLATNATVTAIVPDATGHVVNRVELSGPDGQRRSLSAGTVVLCAGGIENARLLLASNRVVTGGLGNARDVVGRYLMDHPRGTVAAFDLKGTERLQRRFGLYNVNGNLFRAGLRLSPTAQRSEGLLNCSAWLGESVTDDDPWHAVKRILRGKPRLPSDLVTIASNAELFVRGLKEYFVDRNGLPRKLVSLSLDCMSEQRPDRDSRVTLSDRVDRFGMPLSRIDWRIHADEERSIRRTAEFAAVELARMGFPEPTLAEWVRDGAELPPEFVDIAHPSGTTRMSDDPARGVVDNGQKVHGVEGLYVAGSSVFPTAGHCNPTQMIVATTLRLADALKARARAAVVHDAARAAVGTASAEEETTGENRPLLLLTGATGRIGRFVVPRLLKGGYRVRATSSGATLPPDFPAGLVNWRRLDLKNRDADIDDLVAGCSAVIHLAAAMTEMADMPAVNVEGTRSLAQAAEGAGIAIFVYASSVAVYGSGATTVVSEDGPVLTHERDVMSEYRAVDELRAYGRTKLGGEVAIRGTAARTRYVIFRPTVVVDVPDLIAIRGWERAKRDVAAHRHAHHVYVGDVADALVWAVERGLSGVLEPGTVETYNLGEDDLPRPTHADFLRDAYAASGDVYFRARALPWVIDWARDAIRFRNLTLRRPLWAMRFSNARLKAAGWSPPVGMQKVRENALSSLKRVNGSSEAT